MKHPDDASPLIVIIAITVLIGSGIILGMWLEHSKKKEVVNAELNCMEQIKVSREREEVLAELVKINDYRVDVLTNAVIEANGDVITKRY